MDSPWEWVTPVRKSAKKVVLAMIKNKFKIKFV